MSTRQSDNGAFGIGKRTIEAISPRQSLTQQAPGHHLDIIVRPDRGAGKMPTFIVSDMHLPAFNFVAAENHSAEITLVSAPRRNSCRYLLGLRHVRRRPCRPHRQGLRLRVTRRDERVSLDFAHRYGFPPWNAGAN